MQKRRLAIVLFCVVSLLVMSSCVKEAMNTAASPIISGAKTLWNCIGNVFKGKKCHVGHTHREEFCECPPEESEIKYK